LNTGKEEFVGVERETKEASDGSEKSKYTTEFVRNRTKNCISE